MDPASLLPAAPFQALKGNLPKSLSYDTSNGKVRPHVGKGGLSGTIGTAGSPGKEGKETGALKDLAKSRLSSSGSFSHGSSPYPNPKVSNLVGSSERINRLPRTESNLSRNDSAVYSEDDYDDEAPGEYEWLSHFKEDGKKKAMPEKEKPKGKPIFRACVNCKKAHLACDCERPCKRCVQSGKAATCVDVEHKKRGRPKLPRNDEGSIIRQNKSDEESDQEVKPKSRDKRQSFGKEREKEREREREREREKEQQPIILSQGGDAETISKHHPGKQYSIHFSPNVPAPFPPEFSDGSPGPYEKSPYVKQEQDVPNLSPKSSNSNENDLEFLSFHTLDGVFTMASPECLPLFGFTSEEYKGQSLFEFVHHDDRQFLASFHFTVLNSFELQNPIVLRFKTKFGSYVRGELAMTVFKDPKTGHQQYLICSTRLLDGANDFVAELSPQTPDFKIEDPMQANSPHHDLFDFDALDNFVPSQGVHSRIQVLKQEPEETLRHLPHSNSFDTLSNTLGELRFAVFKSNGN